MTLLSNLLRPYRVCVIWDGDVYRHRARTFTEALAWAACYSGTDARVNIFTRRGRWVASR